MRGDDERAMELYERATRGRPALANAYINLGVLHEDRAEYEKAIACYKTVLDIDPNNLRARMFLKDALASLDMYYDEEQERREDKLQQILKIPVTDFELSVRSRNCLEKMKIRSLGDLITKTEEELLSYKNFGETSLMEIKEILASKNLRLGMGRSDDPERAQRVKPEIEQLKRLVTGTPVGNDVLGKPVSELDLSVRSRRCMSKLGITTVGELTQKSVDELMATKNFGATSLREVREKLRALGLSLKDDHE
jgi:DNA-directed RNA polymerase subunit alpha